MTHAGNARLQPGSEQERHDATLERGDPRGEARPASFPSNSPFNVPSDAWHSRGYIPHFDRQSVIQHVTFHLADSLSADALARIEAELISMPQDRQNAERRQRVEAWIDAGYGSCILRYEDAAALVQGALLFFDGVRYRLHAWVIMPNHVHVLFQSINGWLMPKVVASWKSFTGRRLSPLLPEAADNKSQAGAWRSQGRYRRVWHREYWDRFMRDQRHFQRTLDYIHNNPVKVGLTDAPEHWRWSSAFHGNATLQRGSEQERHVATLERGDPRGGER